MKSTQRAAGSRGGKPTPSTGGAAAPAGRGNAFLQERLRGQSEAQDPKADVQSLLATPSRALPRLAELEARLGADLSDVRVHDSADANGIVRQMGAFGLTFGEHIGFAEESPDDELLVHELTHVLQQRGASAGEAADERGADAAARGAGTEPEGPRMGGKAEVRYKLPTHAVDKAELEELGQDKIDGKKAGSLDSKKVAAAIAYNNKKWTGSRREQLRIHLGASPEDATGGFTEDEVRELYAIQLGAGIAADKADGMAGDTTMAILLEGGFSFDLDGQGAVNPKDVTLTFYPGEFEDLSAWEKEVEAAQKIDPERPYRHVTMPEGTGRIYVKHKGNVVAMMNARGGPALTLKDGTHSADPTAKGSWKLGAGHAHTTNAWAESQIPWGAAVRKRADKQWEYQDSSGNWKVATGPASTLKTPLSTSDFESYNKGRSTWQVNDFGAEAWRIEGSPGQLLHTTPQDEEAVQAHQTPVLRTSHGCVHLDPSERSEMAKLGFLQAGVTLVVKAYDQHALPEELRKRMES